MVAEKASRAAPLLVQDVHQRISILRKACRIYDQLVVRQQLLQKLLGPWSDENVNPELLIVYLHRKFNYII